MLRGNLATRPFYNERLVTLAIVLGVVAVVALTAFNVTQILSLSKERAGFKSTQTRDEGEAATVNAGTFAVQKSVDGVRLAALARQTREANDLIDERTFSWTVFLDHVEKTLPMDARLISVAPRVNRGEFEITMTVNARRFDDVEDFIDQLLSTGVFYDTLAGAMNNNDDNTFTSTIVTRYYLAPKPAKAKRGTTGRGR
jgi:Tfp pilus assembly protein PilN